MAPRNVYNSIEYYLRGITNVRLDLSVNIEETRGRRGRKSSLANGLSEDQDEYKNPTMTFATEEKVIQIAVGSTNKAKILAVQQATEKLFADYGKIVNVTSFKVNSGVSDQPMTEQEAIDGAIERAKAAMRESGGTAHFGVGLEGGVHKIAGRWFEGGWIAVVDTSGTVALGSSGRFELSNKIMSGIFSGKELAEVIDELSGLQDVRSTEGAMGILTNGHLPRDIAYSHGVYFAFAPFISPKTYWM